MSVTMVRNVCQSVECLMAAEMGRLGPTAAMLVGRPGSWGREQGRIVEMMGRILVRDCIFPRHDVSVEVLVRGLLVAPQGSSQHFRTAMDLTGQGTPHWECLLAESVNKRRGSLGDLSIGPDMTALRTVMAHITLACFLDFRATISGPMTIHT